VLNRRVFAMARFMGHNRTDIRALTRPDGVQVRHLVGSDVADLTEDTVPAGFSTGASDHDVSEKIGYVVSGAVRITTPDGSVVLKAGGGYAIPRGVPHQFDVLEDAAMIQVRTAAP